MKVGILSDTHLNSFDERLRDFLYKHFSDVDFIIHSGDFTGEDLLSCLSNFKPVIGVIGNNDNFSKNKLREKEILEVDGVKIGIFHGHGEGKTTFERVYDAFKNDEVDIVVFGHSHQPLIRTKGRTVFINPGSPNRRRRERWYSCVLLQVNNGKIDIQMKLSEESFI